MSHRYVKKKTSKLLIVRKVYKNSTIDMNERDKTLASKVDFGLHELDWIPC